jgi:hypothetical protein
LPTRAELAEKKRQAHGGYSVEPWFNHGNIWKKIRFNPIQPRNMWVFMKNIRDSLVYQQERGMRRDSIHGKFLVKAEFVAWGPH